MSRLARRRHSASPTRSSAQCRKVSSLLSDFLKKTQRLLAAATIGESILLHIARYVVEVLIDKYGTAVTAFELAK
jgi:hypothetical protein